MYNYSVGVKIWYLITDLGSFKNIETESEAGNQYPTKLSPIGKIRETFRLKTNRLYKTFCFYFVTFYNLATQMA